MTDLILEHWPVAKLQPYANNPRRNDDAVTLMVDAIREMGFKVPIVARSDGEVVDGHLRLRAAKQLGLETVPVILADDLTPTQIKAFRILVNQSAHWADWDDELLRQEMQALAEMDFELDLIGFSQSELDALLATDDEQSTHIDDETPALEEKAITQPGDLWQLGEHRLLCGDATKRADVDTLMAGEKVQMTFTDPPYNVNYADHFRNYVQGQSSPIMNDDIGKNFYDFLYQALTHVLAVTQGACYVFFPMSYIEIVHRAFTDAKGHLSTIIIWAKNHFSVGKSDYQYQYEPMLYGWHEDADRYWNNARDQSDVWHIDRNAKNDLHPTMKPVALIRRAITNSSHRGDIVLDVFAGSGSTLMACEQTGRQARLMELSPHYVDVIIRRWQKHTGQQAIRQKDSISFNTLQQGEKTL